MIKAMQSKANKKAIITNLDGYESEIVDRFLNRIKTNVKIKDECRNIYIKPNMKMEVALNVIIVMYI